VNVPVSQIGFLKGIIIPSYKIMIDIFPELMFLMENVEKNLFIWQEKDRNKEKSFSKEYIELMSMRNKKKTKSSFKSNKKISFHLDGKDNENKQSNDKKLYSTNYMLINVDDENALE
jgi:hypothetical protein